MGWSLDALNKWVLVVSNMGVIGGFLLLAAQLTQNTQAVRLQSARDLQREGQSAEIAFMGENAAAAYAAAVITPSEMTPEQVGQVWGYMNAGLLAALNTWIAREAGYASAENWAHARTNAAVYIDFKVGRVIWREVKGDYPGAFVEEIDRELALQPPGRNDRQWLRVLSAVKTLDDAQPPAAE